MTKIILKKSSARKHDLDAPLNFSKLTLNKMYNKVLCRAAAIPDPTSDRVEGLNLEHPDYHTSALNHSAKFKLPPKTIGTTCSIQGT